MAIRTPRHGCHNAGISSVGPERAGIGIAIINYAVVFGFYELFGLGFFARYLPAVVKCN